MTSLSEAKGNPMADTPSLDAEKGARVSPVTSAEKGAQVTPIASSTPSSENAIGAAPPRKDLSFWMIMCSLAISMFLSALGMLSHVRIRLIADFWDSRFDRGHNRASDNRA
jgi:hypothetical protein